MKEYHKNCVMTVQTLKHNISTNFSINLLLDKSLKDQISLNRKFIIPVVETIILCGR